MPSGAIERKAMTLMRVIVWAGCAGWRLLRWRPARPSAQAGFDRPGGDYARFVVPSGDPAVCAARCDREARCRAWTFSYPGTVAIGGSASAHVLAEERGEAARGEPVLRLRRQGRRRWSRCVPARSRTRSTASAATTASSTCRRPERRGLQAGLRGREPLPRLDLCPARLSRRRRPAAISRTGSRRRGAGRAACRAWCGRTPQLRGPAHDHQADRIAVRRARRFLLGASERRLRRPIPDRVVRIVVPFAAGAPDSVARILAQQLQTQLGQSVVVENRPAANGVIGTDSGREGRSGRLHAAHLVDRDRGQPEHLPQPALQSAGRSRAGGLDQPHRRLLPRGQPVGAGEDRAGADRARRAKPNSKLSYGSPGIGNTLHLTMELFKGRTGLDIAHVPYRGAGPAINDLLGGQIQVMFVTPPLTLAHIQAGKLRPLAFTGPDALAGAAGRADHGRGRRRGFRGRRRLVRPSRAGEDAARHRRAAAPARWARRCRRRK